MLVNKFSREVVTYRRFVKKLEALGYKRCEPDWEIVRGFKAAGMGHEEVIVDVKIAPGGKEIFYKLGPKE